MLDDIKIEDVQSHSIMDTVMQDLPNQDPAEVSKKIMAEFETDLQNLDAGLEQEKERQATDLEQKLAARKELVEANRAQKALASA